MESWARLNNSKMKKKQKQTLNGMFIVIILKIFMRLQLFGYSLSSDTEILTINSIKFSLKPFPILVLVKESYDGNSSGSPGPKPTCTRLNSLQRLVTQSCIFM